MRTPSKQQDYLNRVFGVDHPALEEIREKMQVNAVDFKSMSPYEVRLLQFLIEGFRVRRVLELGTLYGYSALAMALVLPVGGRLVTVEKDLTSFELAQPTLTGTPVAGEVVSLNGEALDLWPQIEGLGPYDMIFIDANKSGYSDYLNRAEPLLNPGGLIVGDNTFLWGHVWGEGEATNVNQKQKDAMIEFNLKLANREKYNSVLIPTFEGLTVAQKRSSRF